MTERLVSGGAEGLLSALPLAAPRRHRERIGRWLRAGQSTRFGGRVLLDAAGRPLLHERLDDGYVHSLWRYEPDRTEQVDRHGSEPHVTLGAAGLAEQALRDRDALER